ncbi:MULTISPECIES: tetratricopeptide repeat protein [Hyphobacterium]|uniref:Tetratricopeptide repeat protein n=1 Tax=Hyphobacterium vulgare TaxID=1736751 RepID=A0ABV6ZUN5_9PROT
MMIFALIAALIGAAVAIFVLAPFRGADVPRWAGPVSATALLVLAGAVYWAGGAPDQPGAPYAQQAAERRAADPSELNLESRIERLRDIVREDREDAEAWAMLGRELARAEREMEAINAFQRSLSIEPQARTFSDLGQTVINLNEGDVTPDAQAAFEAAYQLDRDLPEAGFFLGLGAYQNGDRETAAQYWTDTLARLEAGDPFRMIISRQAAELLSRPNVDAGAVAAAQAEDAPALSPQERIAGMVGRLDERVRSGEGSLSDWLVLIRVRAMMDDVAGARAALTEAEADFADDSGATAILAVARQAIGNDDGEE